MPPNASDILASVCETYANLGSYRDVGESLTEFWNDACTRTTHRSMLGIATRWRRPDHFYFEFRDRGPAHYDNSKHVVWMQGPRVRTWWSANWDEVEEEGRGISMAIAGATGISSGTACWIARLLGLEGCGEADLTDAIDAVILGDEMIEDRPCWHIEYAERIHPPYRYQIWIEKESHLVRKMFEPIGDQMSGPTPAQLQMMRVELEARVAELGPDSPLRRVYKEMMDDREQGKRSAKTTQTIWWRPEANPVLTDTDFAFDPSKEP